MTGQAWSFLGQVISVGGGAAVISYLLFQFLGKSWIENKFAQRLDQLKHEQALELQRLRVEIDSLLSGALKLQEREFLVLPEAWVKLDEAHNLVSWLAAPFQQYPDLDRMTQAQLEDSWGIQNSAAHRRTSYAQRGKRPPDMQRSSSGIAFIKSERRSAICSSLLPETESFFLLT
jgi:hypothetical protein